MTRRSHIVGLVALGLGLVAAQGQTEGPKGQTEGPKGQTEGPKLALSPTKWDFGAVWFPENPTFTLTVRNDGQAELKLTKITTNCGCTHVQPTSAVVAPGKSVDLKIDYNTKGKQDLVHSSVVIESNDPAHPKLEFPISGIVKRAVRRDPLAGINIRTLETKPGLTSTVKLENATDDPMQLKLVSCSIPWLDVKIDEQTPGRVFQVTARTAKPLHAGVTHGELVFSTGLQREPEYTVEAMVQIVGLVDPVPRLVMLEARATQPATRSINLNYYGERDDFQVTGATCKQLPDIKVTIQPPELPPGPLATNPPKMKYIVKTEVPLPAAAKLPPGGLVIEYTTNDPACPRVAVTVTNDKHVWERALKADLAGDEATTKP
jgi:hypothetical protein